MNGIDILIIVVLAAGALRGFGQGVIRELATLLGFILALAIARITYPAVRPLISPFVPTPQWRAVVAFAVVAVIVLSAVNIGARAVRLGVRLLMLGLVDRLLGLLLGLLEGAILTETFLYLLRRVPNHNLHRLVTHSRLAPTFLGLIPYLHRVLPHVPAR